MTQRRAHTHGKLWRIVLLSAFVVAAVAASVGPAGATTGWGRQSTATAQVVKAAPVAAPMTATATVDNCPFLDFCAFSRPNFQGTRITASACRVKVGIPFLGVGSWVNNQSSNLVQAKLLDLNAHTILITAGATSALGQFDWTDISSVIPCE